jgi:hypothetical protein
VHRLHRELERRIDQVAGIHGFLLVALYHKRLGWFAAA